jgi:hypothetical protein
MRDRRGRVLSYSIFPLCQHQQAEEEEEERERDIKDEEGKMRRGERGFLYSIIQIKEEDTQRQRS